MTSDALPAELRAAVQRVSAVPHLLVACDVDGTLAPIAERPEDAEVHEEALALLADLAGLAGTSVALVSGRPRRDLVRMTGLGPEVVLVGSHGAEHGSDVGLTDVTRALLEQVVAQVRELADGVPGVLVEHKAAGVAVHVRLADRADADRVTRAVVDGPAALDGVRTTHGKEVVELTVVEADKGRALERLRVETGADAVVFAGDDVTDESAFGRLADQDVGIKVGDGDTAARFRVAATGDVLDVLRALVESRRQALV